MKVNAGKLYKFYLGPELETTFERYIHERFPPQTRVQSALVRRALSEFLLKEGYPVKGHTGGVNDSTRRPPTTS